MKYKGIGGWLLLPTLELIVAGIMYSLLALFFVYVYLFSPTLNYYADLLTIIIFGGLAFFSIFPLVLEFQHKKTFIKWAIIFLWIQLPAFLLVDFIYDGGMIDYALSILHPILWTLYIKKSKRVKNTFVK